MNAQLIHKVNKWSFSITVILYLTVFLGMIAQLVLGCIQIILAIIISSRWTELSTEGQQHLKNYWICIGIYSTVSPLALAYANLEKELVIALLFLTPMIIAGYFLHITYEIKESNIENPLEMQENLNNKPIKEPNL